ncbi:SH3 domain-containing protein [Leptospira sp. 96542]|nr:SH3 domain-containing protein [Leptospira sp. 96542]
MNDEKIPTTFRVFGGVNIFFVLYFLIFSLIIFNLILETHSDSNRWLEIDDSLRHLLFLLLGGILWLIVSSFLMFIGSKKSYTFTFTSAMFLMVITYNIYSAIPNSKNDILILIGFISPLILYLLFLTAFLFVKSIYSWRDLSKPKYYHLYDPYILIFFLLTIFAYPIYCTISDLITTEDWVIVDKNSISVYEEPSEYSKHLAVLGNYDTFHILSSGRKVDSKDNRKEQGFFKIKTKHGLVGYVQRIEVQTYCQRFKLLSEETKGTVNASALILRELPTRNSLKIQSIEKNGVVTIKAKSQRISFLETEAGYWYYVTSKSGKSGYVFGAYLTID